MTSVIVNRPRQALGRESGVALLQVLLLGAVMSLIAIRFTETAHNQVAISGQIEDRVRAQLAAHSVSREVIFLKLSSSIEARQLDAGALELPSEGRSRLNGYGESIVWREGVEVSLQDLNGLLPQIFPAHPFWHRFLSRKSIEMEQIRKYIGVWEDIQDSDTDSWQVGGVEPVALPTGEGYLNGYAQNDKVIRWVFQDRPDLLSELLVVSDVHGKFDTNPANYSNSLLNALFDEDIAANVISQRESSKLERAKLNLLFPEELNKNYVVNYNSNGFKLNIHLEHGAARWHALHTIILNAGNNPPYKLILNN